MLVFLQWFILEGIQSGRVHLKLQWLSLQTDREFLKEVGKVMYYWKRPARILRILIMAHRFIAFISEVQLKEYSQIFYHKIVRS